MSDVFIYPINKNKCKVIHINQAKNPCKVSLGIDRSTTALFLPTVAILPLFTYLNGIIFLFFANRIKLLARFFDWSIATLAN